MGFTGGKLPEPSQKQESWMKHVSWGIQHHSRPHEQRSGSYSSLSTCLGGDIEAFLLIVLGHLIPHLIISHPTSRPAIVFFGRARHSLIVPVHL